MRQEGRLNALAHGPHALETGVVAFLRAWPLEPLLWLSLLTAAWAYARGARAVPAFPRKRLTHFRLGLLLVALALASPIAAYGHSFFWVHMVQHMLLVFGAAPLIVLGAPLTLLLRAASPSVRRRTTRLLHAAIARAVVHPVVAWSAFTLVMWVTHFSGLYNAALRSEAVHGLEHLLYLVAALLFWWPVVGLDPGANRMSWPVRILYLVLALPQQSFLGLAIYSADRVLYAHYETVARGWGPGPLDDQRLAALVMWLAGDALFVLALMVTLFSWMGHDRREAARVDRRLGVS